MLIGYSRASHAEGLAKIALQRSALLKAGVHENQIFEEVAPESFRHRPVLEECLDSMRAGDTLVVCHLNRLGRSVRGLALVSELLKSRGAQIRVISGPGAKIYTGPKAGAPAVLPKENASRVAQEEATGERTSGAAAATRAGRPRKLTANCLRQAVASLAHSKVSLARLAKKLGISKSTLQSYVNPDGTLKSPGVDLLLADHAATEGRSDRLRS